MKLKFKLSIFRYSIDVPLGIDALYKQKRLSTMPIPLGKMGRIELSTLKRLKSIGITTDEQLSSAVNTESDFIRLCQDTGISQDELRRVVQRVELRQIDGIGTIYEYFLELIDIRTCEQLATMDGPWLHQTLLELNDREKIARRSPNLEEIQTWIAQAKSKVNKPPL